MRVFSSNCLVKTLEITAVNQYISSAAQLFGSQDYYNRCLMMIIGLASVLLPRLRNHNATDDGNVDFRSFRNILRSRLGKLL